MKKITVVTICYNAEKCIKETIQSVLGQSYTDFEYLIIDGKSKDNTIDIIKEFEDERIILVSEKDNGIYDAMNKGIRLSSGEYIIFMNSGDVFADSKVLEDISSEFKADVVFGNALIKKQEGIVREKYSDKKFRLFIMFLSGYMINHQTIFTKTELIKKYMFDLSYKICADRALYAKLLKNKISFKRIDRDIVKYDGIEGISSKRENLKNMILENDRVIKENFRFAYLITNPLKQFVRIFRHL
jgi:glycosyltransferase involved in cell wall biosynthesis